MSAGDMTPDALPQVTLPSGDVMRAAARYADVRQVLSDPRFSRDLRGAGSRMVRGTDISDDRHSLLNMDPPRHSRIRRTVSGAFAPRRVQRWRPRVVAIAEELATELLDSAAPADMMTTFAFPLPMRVICELLGVPQQDRARFRGWSEMALTTSTATADQRTEARREFRGYVAGFLAGRRAEPGDALIDDLLAARDGDEGLSAEELVSLTINLITAGHETTANLIGSGLYTLTTQDRYRSLHEIPEAAMERLVEEILRHDTPAPYAMPRLATDDVDLPSGTIRKGELVLPMPAAANRDPAAFSDPDSFDSDRTEETPHLTFGHGPHFCLGAGLARLETEAALRVLSRRLPDLRLAVPPADVRWRTDSMVGGPMSLPVRW